MKKRHWYVAGLLSLFVAGLGQVYNGQARKGVLFIALELILGVLLMRSDIADTLPGLIIIFCAILLIHFFIVGDAIVAAIKKKEIQPRWYNNPYLYIGILAITLLPFGDVLKLLTIYENYTIPSASMSNTLLPGDYMVVEKRTAAIAFQDIVVFRYPYEPEIEHIKRLIGLPGDKIMIKDKELWRNGEKLAEPYVQHVDAYTLKNVCDAPPEGETMGCPCRDNIAEFTVPPGMFFVLGDNRDAAKDSRCFGFIPQRHLVGKALYIFFSEDLNTEEIRFERIGHFF
jgi:signal peptidase I